MSHRNLFLAGAGIVALGGAASAQSFVNTPANVPSGNPFNNSSTENVDFGDVDLDGDWDAIFADGGDDGNDQNRIWINNGGLQGGTIGTYSDETSTRFPTLNDDSRDIEFVDYDDDGDLDIYVSNTAQLTNQGNRWLDNDGGEQGGTLGVYTETTGMRWLDLGQTAAESGTQYDSSIPDSLVFMEGGSLETFIDWSCDCDFGDLDNDGDMDLAHSSYGGAFGGLVPTRMFLNDGDGFFEEYNPSNFQLTVSNISNGQAALWAEGIQQANTANTTGVQADIASSALDIDLGDIDGDFDLDMLHGARQELPRMFQNRLEEKGGVLGFRDITNFSFPAGYSTGDGHYEQEMDDLDGDGDLDLYGLNWQTGTFTGFNDIVAENQGNGAYTNLVSLSGSGDDDNEGDFIDYDNDGDLDLIVANFSGQNRLYRNNNNGGGPGFTFTNVTSTELAGDPNCVSLDADACDVDNDGDYDYIDACDNFVSNKLLLNVTQVPDTTAPWIPNVEQATGGAASATDDVIRAQVYDNSPYYITWFNPTVVDISVDGYDLGSIKAKSVGGQIFRAEIPGNYVGLVEYSVRSEDEYANSGSSSTLSYTNTGNTGSLIGGTSPSSAGTPTLKSLAEGFAGKPLPLVGGNVAPGSLGIMGFSLGNLGASGVNFGNGIVGNLALPLVGDLVIAPTDANGDMLLNITSAPNFPGTTLYTQFVGLDGTGGDDYASSQALGITLN